MMAASAGLKAGHGSGGSDGHGSYHRSQDRPQGSLDRRPAGSSDLPAEGLLWKLVSNETRGEEAMISLSAIVQAILFIIIAGLVFYLLLWLLSYIGLPEPFAKVARVILAVAAVFVLIAVLLSLAGHPIVTW
jgi:hypothetical protein